MKQQIKSFYSVPNGFILTFWVRMQYQVIDGNKTPNVVCRSRKKSTNKISSNERNKLD